MQTAKQRQPGSRSARRTRDDAVRGPAACTADHDGVDLAFTDVGSGDPPLLLIHGWGCDRSVFDPQIDHFVRLGHRVLVPDLRGHGASVVPPNHYAIATFADDIVRLCARASLQQPVLVGHSMGGVVAFDIALRYPALATAVVLLDAPLFPPPELVTRGLATLDRLAGRAYSATMREYVAERLFLPTDDPDVRALMAALMASVPQHVLLAAMQGIYAYDPDVPPASIALPLLVVQAASGRVTGVERLRQVCTTLWTGQTVGAGHFHQLLVPDQVNAMIDRFLAVALSKAV